MTPEQRRPSAHAPPQQTTLDWLTGLRGVAALYVLLSHVWYHVWPAVLPPYGYGRYPEDHIARWTGWLYYGHFGVVVFVVLSGFCLMRTVVLDGGHLSGGPAAFFKRRALRILPPYYLALLLALALIALFVGHPTGTQWDISIPVTAEGLLIHLFLLQDVFATTQINYVFWSIALEMHLYLLFPLLVRLWQRHGAARVTLGTALLVYGTTVGLETAGVHDLPPQYVGLVACFVLGMAAAHLALDPATHAMASRNASALRLGAWALWSLAAACCAAWEHVVAENRLASLDALVATGVACLLTSASHADSTETWVLRRPMFQWAGRISYSLYLLHAPLLQLTWCGLIGPIPGDETRSFFLLLVSGIPISLFAAQLFYSFAEKPFLPASRAAVLPGR